VITGAADRPGLLLPAVTAAGAVLGGLTAFGQQWLPSQVGSLANSVGTWATVAFCLALLARRRATALGSGALALLALVIGYYGTSRLRGYPVSTSSLVFWPAAAVLAGPGLGLAAHWLRHGTRTRAAVATGAVSGVLVGEGVYGLVHIADTTYPPYWWTQLLLGALLLPIATALRLRDPRLLALATAVAAATATGFVLAYSQNLIALL
jgi:peptidoglycan/LPS O-acetylase OafA/YrhL